MANGKLSFDESLKWVASARNAAFLFFVFADWFSTFIGLSTGYFIEGSPFAYIFGDNIYVVMAWLLVQKVVFFLGVEWVVWRYGGKNYLGNMHFLYGLLAGAGLLAVVGNVHAIIRLKQLGLS